MKKIIIVLVIVASMLFSSCASDYMDTRPSVAISSAVALGTVDEIDMAMKGIYIEFGHKNYTNEFQGYSIFNLYHDALASNQSSMNTWGLYLDYWQLNINQHGLGPHYSWIYLYNMIMRVNDVLGGLNAITPSDDKKELHSSILGQALGMRALFYQELNLLFSPRYDEVKAVTTLSVPKRVDRTSGALPRATQKEITDFIFQDISNALVAFSQVTALPKTKEFMTPEVLEVIKLRMLMYMGRYTEVVELTKEILATTDRTIMGATSYYAGFNSITNPEWIFASVISSDKTIYFYWTGIWLNYDFLGWGYYFAPRTLDMAYLFGVDNSDIKHVGDAYGIADGFKSIPSTKGLVMRPSDARYDMFLADDDATIQANKAINYNHYVPKWGGAGMVDVVQGVSRKFKELNGDRKADVVMMRLAEVYYIGAEAASLMGDDGQARLWLAATAETYDAGATAAHINTKSGKDLRTLIANYKAVDMWGEGTTFADVKRRGDWVYRLSKYNPEKSLINEQYKSTPPYNSPTAASNEGIFYPDFTTLPIPQKAFEGNSLLEQNKY